MMHLWSNLLSISIDTQRKQLLLIPCPRGVSNSLSLQICIFIFNFVSLSYSEKMWYTLETFILLTKLDDENRTNLVWYLSLKPFLFRQENNKN